MVYLVATSAGGLALVVTRQTLRSRSKVSAAGWTVSPSHNCANKLGEYFDAYAAGGNHRPTGRPGMRGWPRSTGRRLAVGRGHGPVVEHRLPARRQAALIPTGLLALLPLHAAWTEDAARPTGRRYALDEVAFRYAASAVALIQALENAARGATASCSRWTSRGPSAATSFLTPRPRSRPSHRCSRRRRSCDTSRRPGPPFWTRCRAQIVHLSCHGATNWAEPLRSGVVMARDEMLTVGDLLDRRLPTARLTTLSACETGIVGTELLDEVVALPTALAQAGFAGVAASLWSVEDVSTAMLMERFYRLWREDGLAPVLALREAQRWLRDTTNREKADYFRRDVPALSAGRMPEMVAARFLQPDHRRRPGRPRFRASLLVGGVLFDGGVKERRNSMNLWLPGAIERLRPELPALVGDDWPAFAARLDALLPN